MGTSWYWLPYSPGVPLAVWMARTPAWSREIYPRPGPPSRTRTFLRLSFPGLRPWWHYKAHRRFSRQSRERGQTASAVNGPGHRSKNGVRCSDFRKGVKSGAPKGLGFGAGPHRSFPYAQRRASGDTDHLEPHRRRSRPQPRGHQVHRRRPEGAAGQLNSLSTGRQPEAGCACGTRSLGGVANKANSPANAAEHVNTMMGN